VDCFVKMNIDAREVEIRVQRLAGEAGWGMKFSQISGRKLAGGVGLMGLGLLHLWAVLALYFWFVAQPVAAWVVAAVYVGLVVLVFRLAGTRGHGAMVSLVLFVAVVAWWSRRKPELDLVYPQETEQAARLEVEGNFLTVHAMRDFRYRSETEYDAHWSSRTYDLNQLTNVDLSFVNWGIPDVDHVITSFVFADQPPLAVSIELRAEKGEPNTLLRGFFKQYELFYVWADEQDVIKLRTNYRKEEASVFRTSMPPEKARLLLLDMAERSNALQQEPEFYNTLTDNCTNVIAQHVDRINGRQVPWYRRPLKTGSYVQIGYEQGWLVQNQPWEEFRKAAVVNERAVAAGDSAEFSKLIRTHLPTATAVVEQYPSQ
jgi:hypothetical protein